MAEQRDGARSARLDHVGGSFGPTPPPGLVGATRRRALALTAEGPRRADLIAWCIAHRAVLAGMRLLAPTGVGALLAEQCGLTAEPLRSGTIGPAATAGLAAAGDIDAMVAFTDPIELRPGDTTTRSLTRLAVFWDIPVAGNRATADLLLAALVARGAPAVADRESDAHPVPVRNAVQLWNVRATVDDVPGRLAILAASLARRAINILSVQVHLTPDGPVDELLVSASPVLTTQDLVSAVVDGGARNPRVTPTDAHALVDAPTRALTLATRLVRSPDDLPTVLTSLLPGAQLAWRAEPPEGHEDDLAQFWLADPTGGGYLLTRPTAPFTPAERARAFAMIDLATMTQARSASARSDLQPEGCRLVLADGTEVTVRPSIATDLRAVADMHSRCSMNTLLRRYLSGTSAPSDAVLARMLAPANGDTLVVEDRTGAIVAVGSLMWTVAGDEAETGELTVLVEDAWQQRRLGTLLTRRLLDRIERPGPTRVKVVVHAGNAPMIRLVTALCAEPGRRLHREYDAGTLTLIVALSTHAPA